MTDGEKVAEALHALRRSFELAAIMFVSFASLVVTMLSDVGWLGVSVLTAWLLLSMLWIRPFSEKKVRK